MSRRTRVLAVTTAVTTAVVTAVVGTAMIAAPASAAWRGLGTRDLSVTAGSLSSVALPAATRGSGSVAVSWTAPAGPAPARYEVLRHDGTSTTVACTATAPTTTCTDSSPVATGVAYGVRARVGSAWVAVEGPTAAFTYDNVAPTTTATASPVANAVGWNQTAVTLALSATDGTGTVSGVAGIRYAVDGTTTTVTGGTANVTVSGAGLHTVTFAATDRAGNTEATTTRTVKIDPTAPVTTLTRSAQPNAAGWNTAPVTLTFAPTDGGSGVATVVYDVDGTVTTVPLTATSTTTTVGSGTHTVRYHAIDVAGNVETDRSVDVKVDTAGPTLSAPAPAANATPTNNNTGGQSWSRVCASGRVCVTVADTTSGVDAGSLTYNLVGTSSTNNGKCWSGTAFVTGTSCAAPMGFTAASGLAAGSDIPTGSMADGSYAVTVTARDVAGNTTTSSVTFTVT